MYQKNLLERARLKIVALATYIRNRFSNKTISYIKPENMDDSLEILKDIKNEGFKILRTKMVRLSKEIILGLYPYLLTKPELREITYQQLLQKVVLVMLIKKGNAINDFVQLCGDHFNPDLCAPNTIRRKYYKCQPIIVGEKKYYPNVIHRVRTHIEYYRNFIVFFGSDTYIMSEAADKILKELKNDVSK